MRFLRIISVILVAVVLGWLGLEYLDRPSPEFAAHERNCQTRGVEPEVAKAACTALIESGKYSGEDLGTLHFRRAAHFHSRESWPLAAEDYAQAIKLGARVPSAYWNRGNLHAKFSNDLEAAIADYTYLLNLPNLTSRWKTMALQARARLYLKAGQMDLAKADFDQLDPKFRDPIEFGLLNARANEKQQNHEAAFSDYDRVIKLLQARLVDGKDVSKNRGLLERAIKQITGQHKDMPALMASDDAIALIDAALTREGGHALLYLQRGRQLMSDDSVAGGLAAAEDFTAAMEVEPEDTTHAIARALAYWQAERVDLALADLDALVGRLDPERTAAKERMKRSAALAEQDRNSKEALALYRVGLAEFSSYKKALKTRAEIFRAEDRLDDAVDDYSTLIAVDRNEVEWLILRGSTYQKLGRLEAALGDFDKAITLHDDPDVLRSGWLRLDGKIAAMFALRSKLHREMGKKSGAVDDMVRAISYMSQTKLRDIQTSMKAKGYYRGPVNGVMDAGTERALREFLKDGF